MHTRKCSTRTLIRMLIERGLRYAARQVVVDGECQPESLRALHTSMPAVACLLRAQARHWRMDATIACIRTAAIGAAPTQSSVCRCLKHGTRHVGPTCAHPHHEVDSSHEGTPDPSRASGRDVASSHRFIQEVSRRKTTCKSTQPTHLLCGQPQLGPFLCMKCLSLE